jgi:hypothetical protein
MSLLQNSEVLPMYLIAVTRYLAYIAGPAGESIDAIDRLMTHTVLRGNDDSDPEGGMVRRVKDTCAEFVRLGLFVETTDGRIQLGQALSAFISAGDHIIPLAVTDAVLRPGEGDEQFGRALAWYLSLDPLTAPGSWDQLAKSGGRQVDTSETELATVAKSLGIGNDTRFGQFRHWCCFLGFAWGHALQGNVRILPDPTSQLRWRLSQVFGEDRRLSLPVFLDRLSNRCSVLDGGDFREAIPKTGPGDSGAVSRTTSLALLRLHDEGTIVLESSRADADRVLLHRRGQLAAYTHVALALERTGGL